MSRSPQTPRHSRHPSSIDVPFPVSSSPARSISPNIRRASKSSFQDPLTPLRTSMNEAELALLSGGGVQDNGLGNLADELADALSGSDDDDDEDEYYEDGEGPSIVQHDDDDDDDDDNDNGDGNNREAAVVVDGVDGAAAAATAAAAAANNNNKQHTAQSSSLSIPPNNGGRGHRRTGSAYDGSEYGSESDLDIPGMPPSLVSRIDAVELLARRGSTDSPGGPTDGVFKRLTDGLRDLGSQSSVEGSTTRLITAHSALATHLAHQTRQLHNLTFPLLSPLVAPPDAATIDALLPLLASVSAALPRPAAAALGSLAALHAATADLAQALAHLADTLHMSRQATATAARRLRTARDTVADLRREDDRRAAAERWLARGRWGDRLRDRECAGVCRDVVGGFEEVCDGWRARLLAQAAES